MCELVFFMWQIRLTMMNLSLESYHKIKVRNIWPACWCGNKTQIWITPTDSLINSALKENTVNSYRISIYLFALTSFLSDSKYQFDPEADGHQHQSNIYLNKISKRSPRESKVSVTGLQMMPMSYSSSEYKLDIYKMSLQQFNLIHNTYECLRNNIFCLINN